MNTYTHTLDNNETKKRNKPFSCHYYMRVIIILYSQAIHMIRSELNIKRTFGAKLQQLSKHKVCGPINSQLGEADDM